ncbi:hypothetical protein KTO58_02995 [Chitinophaga pendula]|uniref:hypothetical protein n=1 Tax=Chitinophaga TaxID=79328 RepID=UPI000BB0857C|nr:MULTISPECIES: hypothetical protein [Chitinophaga]ASZ14198.1 hypothetical protein CK934_26225 [Chitinophaga sp. MD30]UCJ08165.1 hypothetical protein KTO58_02995 [Chitinophaga pendula]
MDSTYNLLLSNNPFVEAFRELMPVVIAIVLLVMYYRGRLSAMDTILYAFATEAYSMVMVGPTFTSTFFVGMGFFADQVHRLFTDRLYIKRPYLLLLIVPALSSLMVFLIVQLYKDPFYYPQGKFYNFYLRPVYFYVKTYLPLFAIGAKIAEEIYAYSFEDFCTTVKRIARWSFIIATAQIISQFVFGSVELGEILGMQHRYLQYQSRDIFNIRIQALFSEPKIYSAFLSLCIPLFLRDRNYKLAAVAFVMGVLTVSQTFWINLLAVGIVFLVIPRIRPVRLKIVSTMGIIILIFVGVAASKEYFFKQYAANQHNMMYQLVLKRSVYRYDTEIWGKNNIILGMPLQRDLELPVVDFMKDEPYLLFSGYGPGNSTFIPAHYFFGQLNYELRLAGVGGNNLNMRWFFILVEFGGLALLVFFFVLTRTRAGLSSFHGKYFALVWVCFFFSQIDLFLIITAVIGGVQPLSSPGLNEEI